MSPMRCECREYVNRGDCCHTRDEDEAQSAELFAAMNLLGYGVSQTGGGCTAYTRTIGTDSVYITKEDGPEAPESIADRVYLSRISDNGEILYERREQTVAHALEIVGGWLVQSKKEEESHE